MNTHPRTTVSVIFVLVAASAVYLFAHRHGLVDPYVINDDVRQQVYWMQQWSNPDLFPDDYLGLYARHYVPWGVKAIYRLGAEILNPVQFTKVVTGVLYVICALLLFRFVLAFSDELGGLMTICVYFFFAGFMMKISGGLAQSFAFPLLIGYLVASAYDRVFTAGMVIFLQSLFNPYIFILCSATQGLQGVFAAASASRRSAAPVRPSVTRFALSGIPVALGGGVLVVQYCLLFPEAFGGLATLSDMVGRPEFTASGRYELIPIPSLAYELMRPWTFHLPFDVWGTAAGVFFGLFGLTILGLGFVWREHGTNRRMLIVLGSLLIASLVLYLVSRLVLMKLFVPRRYLEFSLSVVYCVSVGLCLRRVIIELGLTRIAFPLLTVALVALGAARVSGTGIYDYGDHAALYRFIRSTPTHSLTAGHPRLMDSVMTFGRRPALVTYELSHPWRLGYWDEICMRTRDFFTAYYASDPATVREFGRKYGVDYLIVREEDFAPERLERGDIYFEPFGCYAYSLLHGRDEFAVLDETLFPPVFRTDGVRVLRLR